MAVLVRKEFLIALILIGGSCWVHADSDNDDDEVTVETVDDLLDTYTSPVVDSNKVYLAEHFDDEPAFKKKWVKSETKKQGVDEDIAKYDGKWELQSSMRPILKNDLGLVLTTAAKHAAISSLLDRPFHFKDKPLIVQYEVALQEGQNCGGAYLKLLSKGTDSKSDLKKFHDQTAYTIMFGPDKCGNDNKLHFIFRHKNPKTGVIEEKHSKKPEVRLEDYYKDKEPHLYTLVVRPDNTFSVLIDNKEVNSGSLLEDFTPAVNPPEEIDDPTDVKPTDWDEREKIVDPTATKPDDWDEDAPAEIVDPNAVKPDGWLDDEPDHIPDPDAKKPSDWDEDIDGEWEAPLIDNPACTGGPGCGPWSAPLIPNPHYKGIWRAPLIPNPNYKGKWTPRKIANPNFFRDEHPFRMTPIHAVGFELWSMSPMLLFDNLIITDDIAVAEEWARNTFALKRAKLFRDSDSVWDKLVQFAADNPWIYAFLILVAILIIGVITFLCFGGTKESDEAEDPKKTDAVQEDDPHQESDDEKVEQVEPQPSGRRSKTALEDASEVQPDTTEETPLVDTEGAGGDGQRKRKSRRE